MRVASRLIACISKTSCTKVVPNFYRRTFQSLAMCTFILWVYSAHPRHNYKTIKNDFFAIICGICTIILYLRHEERVSVGVQCSIREQFTLKRNGSTRRGVARQRLPECRGVTPIVLKYQTTSFIGWCRKQTQMPSSFSNICIEF